MKRTLYWVTKDLRIADNAALQLASQSNELICVYIIDKKWFEKNKFQSKPLGEKRWQFLQASLNDLNQSLSALEQQLYIVYGDTLSTLGSLCEQFQITDIITTKVPGTDENSLLSKLHTLNPELTINQVDQFTLFTENALPFEINNLPASYSKFRKVMSSIAIQQPSSAVKALPCMFQATPSVTLYQLEPSQASIIGRPKQGHIFKGGEQQGLKHLKQYFASENPSVYKEVRNSLDGWENSTKLSPWINYGCLSVRQVMQQIKDFEQSVESNKSTESLYLELLWRDYFQWVHFKVDAKMYQFKGLVESAPLTTFYPERFKKWCLGKTPYPLVNACMNELRHSGYLSNRGRQIVASCLVNELSVDWRYGAAWFEEQLIDYDAAINWGNWQYIAGVGVDPRGGRHFNIKKQTNTHDLNGAYQAKWLDKSSNTAYLDQILDSVDASDWPISSDSATVSSVAASLTTVSSVTASPFSRNNVK